METEVEVIEQVRVVMIVNAKGPEVEREEEADLKTGGVVDAVGAKAVVIEEVNGDHLETGRTVVPHAEAVQETVVATEGPVIDPANAELKPALDHLPAVGVEVEVAVRYHLSGIQVM